VVIHSRLGILTVELNGRQFRHTFSLLTVFLIRHGRQLYALVPRQHGELIQRHTMIIDHVLREGFDLLISALR
jgi:hypothetical protein